MITVNVKLFATLQNYNSKSEIGQPFPVSLSDKATVGNLIELLNLPEIKLIFINGIAQKEADALKDGDSVAIFPPVGGG
jgi:molybdopterin converting factor small subunit